MQITVVSIRPCDYDNQPDFPKMEAIVQVYDDQADFHNSAKINVFIEKRDAPFSVLKEDAIQTALTFLKNTLSSRS